jgi:hypothetical protein
LCPSEEVKGCWSKLYNEELFYLYSSVNIIRVIKSRRLRWAGHVAHMGKQRNEYSVFIRKPEGNRPHGGPRHR